MGLREAQALSQRPMGTSKQPFIQSDTRTGPSDTRSGTLVTTGRRLAAAAGTTVCAAATIAATAAALFATAALFKPCRRRHHQPARVAGSNGTLTIGSAEVVWVSKACTHLTKGSHIKGAAEDEGSLNKCGSSQYLCLRNGLLEAQNVHYFRCAA